MSHTHTRNGAREGEVDLEKGERADATWSKSLDAAHLAFVWWRLVIYSVLLLQADSYPLCTYKMMKER